MNSTYSKPGDTTVTLEKTANTTYQLDSTQVRYQEAQFGLFSTNFFASVNGGQMMILFHHFPVGNRS
jgi:hypothetical protein